MGRARGESGAGRAGAPGPEEGVGPAVCKERRKGRGERLGRRQVKQAGGEGFGPEREKGRVEGLGVLFFLTFVLNLFKLFKL
jgi:hypothetical protein